MRNKVKQIAVIIGAINLDNQKRLIEGMEMAAKEMDCNLFVFTNYIGTRETEESVSAATQVLKLPDFRKFDGAVLVPNTIHNPQALDHITKQLNVLAKPMVSIDRKMDGMSYVGINSYEAEYEIVEHFLYHGYTDILYVSGNTMVSSEARKRFMAYQDALVKNNVEFKEDNVYEGSFTYESGMIAARQILEDGKHPEAIICANDDMALGVISVLTSAGYAVPEDVKIAGFDDVEMSKLNRPTLTTVNKSQIDVGYKAVEEVLELLDGKDLEEYELPCTVKYRESCGCRPEDSESFNAEEVVEVIKHKYVTQQMDTIFMADIVRGMTSDFTKARTPIELYEIFKQYVPSIGVKKFYLCTCEKEKVFVLPERNLGRNIDVMHVSDDYTPTIEMSVAYEDGQFVEYPVFERGIVLPAECRDKSGGNTYVVNQIFYQNCCYGYTVCERVDSVVASGLYYSMLMELGVGLDNVRHRMLLKDAVDRLNGMWCYDNLTKLYNRSGFSYEAKSIMDHLRADDKNVFIIFMDADGLKTINDTIGHDAGDLLIREIGAVVHRNVSNEMLGMRYGGDEFVLFGGFADGEEYKLQRILDSIQEDIAEVNASGKYQFTISSSVGASYYKAREVESLDALIEQADQKMYEDKREKKRRALEGK